MTKYQHLSLSILFFTVIIFEIIVFNTKNHPMILLLGFVAGFNLGAFFIKNKK